MTLRKRTSKGGILAAMGAAGGAVLGLAALNRRLEGSGGRPDGWPVGEVCRFRWRGGDLAYTVAGEGEPLLLVHGVYAGASSFEFRKNLGQLSRSFRVYALDLLGCGASDRPRRRYAPEDVAAQVEDFAREEIGGSAHLIASSLTGALVIPALVRSPRLFKKVALICPTGYRSLERPSGRLGDAVHAMFAAPVLGDGLYHALVSRRGIRYYLETVAYQDPAFVTGGLVEDIHRIAHGPGAKYFPAAFVSGKLNFGVADYWPRVPHRTMICWGQEAKTSPVHESEDFLQNNPRAEPRIFRDAALLPHDERAEAFNKEVSTFLSDARTSAGRDRDPRPAGKQR